MKRFFIGGTFSVRKIVGMRFGVNVWLIGDLKLIGVYLLCFRTSFGLIPNILELFSSKKQIQQIYFVDHKYVNCDIVRVF